jgi:hypothetical protein
MKKILSIIMIDILIIGGFGVIIMNTEKASSQQSLGFDEYDMLIIAPNEFSDYIEPLIEHKNSFGIHTFLKTTDEIYDKYDAFDDAEKIKFYIKDIFDQYNISYVLIIGGRIPGKVEKWFVPVRYVTIKLGIYEFNFISDLYYSDIYDNDNIFQIWDTNKDNIFDPIKDEIDMYPDVFVGRWPCRNENEVKIMIEKTISYETTKQSIKKVVLIGGDTFDDNMKYNEGELITSESGKFFQGYEIIDIFASNVTIDGIIIRESIANGASFMHFKGHAYTTYWLTFENDQVYSKSEPGFGNWDIPLFNNNQFPIVVFGGCHTAMFNISIWDKPYNWPQFNERKYLPIIMYLYPHYECISWAFANKRDGGSIASLGYTCYSYSDGIGEKGDKDNDSVIEPDCIEHLSGRLEIEFFSGIGKHKINYLGESLSYAQKSYINMFMINKSGNLYRDAINLFGFVLLGDPSLKIGGYS